MNILDRKSNKNEFFIIYKVFMIIIVITCADMSTGTIVIAKSVFPLNEKPISIACGRNSVIVAGSSGRVFSVKVSWTDKPGGNVTFEKMKDRGLERKEIIEVSGINEHFLAVCKDGKVLARGSNNYCQLGLGEGQSEASEFTEIKSLSKHKIISASAGFYHSLFITLEGKVLACGYNNFGELLIYTPTPKVYLPIETTITSGASFCIAGCNISLVFVDCEAPSNTPNRSIVWEEKNEAANSSTDEVSRLKEEDSKLKEKVSKLEEENSKQKEIVFNLTKENSEQKEKFSKLEEENSKEKEEFQKLLHQLEEENAQLKRENSQLKENLISLKSKEQQHSHSQPPEKSFRILGEEEIQNLDKLEDIGSGGGGKVTKVAKKELYALKQMIVNDLNATKVRNFIQEYEIMNILHHPNVLDAIGIFMSSASIPPCILLEYCPTNLQKAVESMSFSNTETVKVIYQIAEGMKYIHSKKVIHRDLKPTNILLSSDGTVKICDFGISKLMTIEEQTMTRGLGSQKFMAPEILNEEDNYDEKVDVYSFGVVVFFVLSSGQLPKIKLFDIPKGKKAEIPPSFTEFSKNLINDCWNLDPKDRPSFEEIVDRMIKNNFNLVLLNKTEIRNVEAFVKQHASKIQQITQQ
ncbi:hypothetical protein M9Y10_042801 [Tritrichomonas musculus]|uniref:mitogen-activated protein kinase kinase n=1 Tax=Tritrichomonas musculus TaxID=1915356 RepID=A0ABR2JY10_9EUKA